VKEMDLPDCFYEERMVINSVLDPDSVVRVNVARSMTPNGKVEFQFVNSADVNMGLSGQEAIRGFQYTSFGWYENKQIELDSTGSYYLEVNCNGLPTINASCKLPNKPQVEKVDLHGDSISFLIVDDPKEDNYYLVRTYAWQETHHSYEKEDGTWAGYVDTVYQQITTESDLEYIEAWYRRRHGRVNNLTGFTFDDEFWRMEADYEADSYLFSDYMFDGQTIEFHMNISFGLNSLVGDSPVIDLFVHSLEGNYYRYLLTLAQYLTTDETPFTDRARVHNNIQGGYGVFGAQMGEKYEIPVQDY